MDTLDLTLRIWRQSGPSDTGQFETYDLEGVDRNASFLEMLDILNEQLTESGGEPVAFEHDCREGICGSCGAMVNGKPHGGMPKTTLCQLHMRHFNSGDVIVIEPFRAKALPVVKDLVVNRKAFDAIVESGGYISTKSGSAPEANQILIPKENAEVAMDAAACIGCSACVAACPNASAMLFTAAKVTHLGKLPQGKIEGKTRVISMVNQMKEQGFGNCSNEYLCEAACPKGISVSTIATMNNWYKQAMTNQPLRE